MLDNKHRKSHSCIVIAIRSNDRHKDKRYRNVVRIRHSLGTLRAIVCASEDTISLLHITSITVAHMKKKTGHYPTIFMHPSKSNRYLKGTRDGKECIDEQHTSQNRTISENQYARKKYCTYLPISTTAHLSAIS
jgi:hypothetical protein